MLLQRSMLEKQWELPFDMDDMMGFFEEDYDDGDTVVEEDEEHEQKMSRVNNKVVVARSGVSARQRRMSGRRRGGRRSVVSVSPELIQTRRSRIYLRGTVSKELLTHKQVVHLSKKIKDGIWLQHQRSK